MFRNKILVLFSFCALFAGCMLWGDIDSMRGKALGKHLHNFGEWTGLMEPGCTENGIEAQFCSVCNIEKKRFIPALGHDWTDWSPVASTPEFQLEMKSKTCKRCSITETMSGIVLGADISEKFNWLQSNVITNGSYLIEISNNEELNPVFLSFSDTDNVTITLISTGGECIISLSSKGSIFSIGTGVTIVLESGITLQGLDDNLFSLVTINSNGELIMKPGSKICDNNFPSLGGGVTVNIGGNFTMEGGEISGNSVSGVGGGVYVGGSFTMTGGIISGNTSADNAGGVFVSSGGGLFIMSGGIISGNTTENTGGGVQVDGGIFAMEDGEISGNTALHGGGVYMYWYGNGYDSFTKTGGTIYGYGEGDKSNVTDAVYIDSSTIAPRGRGSTVGPAVILNVGMDGSAGGWEY